MSSLTINNKQQINQAPNEVQNVLLSRPYLKNDLFYFPNKTETHQDNKPHDQSFSHEKQLIKMRNHGRNQEFVQPVKNLESDKALKISIKQDVDQGLKDLFAQMRSNKKTKSNSTPNKLLIFTPKSTLKIAQPKTQQQNKPKPSIQQYKEQRKQKEQLWKMRQDLSKQAIAQHEKKKKQASNAEVKSAQNKQQKKGESQIKQKSNQAQKIQLSASSVEEKKPEKRAKTSGKQKKIKKQANYVKTDLKRKYRDRFVGALNKNLRMLTKNGKIKRAFAKNKLNTELQFNDGNLYNSYTISLSRALSVVVNLDEEGQIQECQKLQYTIPQTYERQNLEKLINDVFGFKSFRDGQYETIRNILQGKSTLFVSQTASGKSLTYLVSSIILKGLSIIISPLVSLMLDQLDHLPCDLPAACISSLLTYDQKARIINMVKSGKIQMLFITPESFLTDLMYHVKEFPQVSFVCIDQAHSMSELSHSFRSSYLALEDIVLKYFKYKQDRPIVLCLTATANVETIKSISQKLKICETIKSKSVVNKNMFVTISRQHLSAKYEGLLKYLSHPQIRKCKGVLVYCRTKKIMFDVFNYLKNSQTPCQIYHSGLQQKQKVQTIQKFRRGEIRIVIATVALGMGLDFENLQCIVHISMPKSVENFIQQIGRAGRREKRAYCHLFLDKYDYFTERNYFLADELDHKIFENIISTIKNGNKIKKESEQVIKQTQQQENALNKQCLKRLSLKQKELDQIFQQEQSNNKVCDQKDNSNKPNHSECECEPSNKQSQVFKPLSYCRADQIAQLSGLKQQAILNIMLKIQKILGKNIIKILPMSHQILKLSFFKKNEELIKQQSEFYNKLVSKCRNVKGTIHIPILRKCSQLKIDPIFLLTETYGISNKYCLKIQLVNQVFVWRNFVSANCTQQMLQNKENSSKIIEQFNLVQKVSLTKFNIFYSLCFNNSTKSISNIIDRGQIIRQEDPLPGKTILNSFDHYFNNQTEKIYNQIIKQGQSNGQQQTARNIESAFLPITEINKQDEKDVDGCVILFLRHVISNNLGKKIIPTIAPYRDGRIMTRVFMGVNDKNSNWKTYGDHPYWMKFVDKDYRELLSVVRKCITNFIVNQASRILQHQNKTEQPSVKKDKGE